MIVDLIRHDLHGVVGDGVVVQQFCVVEEYETVWQLVSVIEGKLNANASAEEQLGWQVLKQSLPPGSMTGAPKKRSVEILQCLESDRRGLYSGVFGYWCVGGSGDWSVAIRSCFKYDEDIAGDCEEWTIGAGGAITALSDPESEWDEMTIKLHSVLRAFGALPPTSA
jgi:para-aminobenzoate synthetase